MGDDVVLGVRGPNGPLVEAPGDASLDASAVVLACIGTECPAGFGTCNLLEPCAVNFMNDAQNCGACGVVCLPAPDVYMASSCVDGVCQYQCTLIGGSGLRWRDCNDVLDDGCEARVDEDVNNCGACGNKCAPGTPCIRGNCGCFPPETPCSGECVDTSIDDKNCAACGRACGAQPPICDPPPPHTKVGCLESECKRLKCDGAWADCDRDIAEGCASNGCETRTDTLENCGGCGIACKPDQECRLKRNTFECEDKCEKSGRVRCEDDNGECVDLTIDVGNCGDCGIVCSGAQANQINRCTRGLCTIECKAGFADCNGDPSDGCEAELASSPVNCGACGNRCDVDAGQPCVDGNCLMVECDGGMVAR